MSRSRRSRPRPNQANQALPVPQTICDRPVFRLDPVGMSVVPMLFSVRGEKDQRGQIRFDDFLKFLAQMDLKLKRQCGGDMVFVPSADGPLKTFGTIKIHPPHRPGSGTKLDFFYARLYGRTLTRAYNVTAENFEAAKP
ncbi:hypothetical protein MGN70_001481 [Eutypa lata]|nr:hypothetical protein MGN70_001481 [Eutypa lata]